LSPANAVDKSAGTFWSSAGHATSNATEWLQIDFSRIIHLAGVRMTPRLFQGTSYGYPVDYRFEYSYDETGQHWFALDGANYKNQPVPSAVVTHNFAAQVLARRVRIVATNLGKDNFNNYYFQLAEFEPIAGTGVFPFGTSNSEFYDARLNMLWAVYGDFRDAASAGSAATYIFGNEPAWYEWLGLKYGWSASTVGHLGTLRNSRILPWPQSADGYVWSWANQEKWPTGNGSYHQENNARYILGAWRIWCWTRDDSFFEQRDWSSTAPAPRPDVSGDGRTMRQKLREAMRYIEESLQGNLGGIQIEDNGMGNTGRPDGEPSNYWDNWPFGHLNAYNNIYYYAALEAMAQMESYWGNYARATELRQRREGLRHTYFEKFWDAAKGRFIACIDKDGKRWDFGGTFHNIEALAYGLGDQAKADKIFDWLDGARTIAGDTSTGADIYAWKFAPRANTLKIESVGPPYWWFSLNGAIVVTPGTGNARWPMHLENGGAIFYTSYYDLMARLRWRGPDNALARLNTILDEFKIDQLRRDPNVWQLGIIGEFPESGLVPCFLVYGFAGMEPGVDGLRIRPQLPSSWEHLAVRDVRWAGCNLTITVRTNQVQVATSSGSPRAVYLGNTSISPGNQATADIQPGGSALLTLSARSAAAPAKLHLQMQNGLPSVLVQGTVSGFYQLETTGSLSHSNWTTLTNLLLPDSPWLFLDTAGSNADQRFYRAIGAP
jgi:hypothetical protein